MKSIEAGLLLCNLSFSALLLCAGQTVLAQDVTDLHQVKQSSAEVLRAFEPAADQEYELGRGDEISVAVIGQPDLSAKHVIGPDGRISLGVAGEIQIAGKTRSAAAAALRTALSAYYQNVTVVVSVDRYTSNHVLLLGDVAHPGLLSFDGPPSLLEVIARGGAGVSSGQGTSGAAGSPGSLMSPANPIAVPEVCMIYRGEQTLVTVRLRDLVRNGDLGANLRLMRDDVVFVPGDGSYVSVLGSVLHPGVLKLDASSTLQQLLAEAGGPSDKGGRYPKIFLVHPARGSAAGSVTVISLEDVLRGHPFHVAIRSGDILYVPETGFNRAADVLQKVSPLISLVTVAALLHTN
jgi:polysaccharide export outer membrane protein